MPMPVPGRYCGYDLLIDSSIVIPGAMLLDDATQPPDIVISYGRCAVPAEATARLGPYRLRGTSLYFEADGVAIYRCDAGRSITVQPSPDADDAVVAGLLIATALPALLWMRGEIVLHAAAVAMPGSGEAIAITGPSGSGKSTLLAQLLDAGASVVADDTICVRMRGERCWVSGLPGGYFSVGTIVEERPYHTVTVDRQRRAMPLAALFVLGLAMDARDAALDRAAALSALLRARHRPRAVAILRGEGVALQQLALLTRRLQVYDLARPAGKQGLHETIARLELS